MPSIRRLAEQFATDRVITTAEAQALVAKAKEDGTVSRWDKLQLRQAITQHRDKFEPGALAVIQQVLVSLPPPPPPSGQTISLDPSGAHRPVFLTPAGVFTANADGRPPANDAELGDSLFRAAELVDDASGNVFLDTQVPKATRAAAFENVKAALAKVAAGSTPPAGMDQNQALQMRASSATVLLHLMEASTEPDLRAPMVQAYEGLVRAEANVRLRENLIFHFANSAAAQAGPAKEVAATLMKELAPTKPPYEKWFANGSKTVNLQWTVGQGEFWKGFTGTLKSRGFQPVGREDQYGVTVYEKTIQKPGVGETKFRISVREGGTNLLAAMSDPSANIIGYDGHSNWGRNMTSSIRRGPEVGDGGEGKMFVYNLCVGKGVLDQLREKYPQLQPVATFGASYLDTDIDGLCNAIAERADWEKLDQFFNRTDGYWDKQNFVTPIATLVRERVLDRDNDGQADYLDKHFNFNTFKVPEDTAREFRPIKQDRPANILDGTKVNVAAQMLNTVSEFSSILERVNPDSKVVPQGWFDPKMGEKDVVRFTEAKGPDGKAELRMQVNARYSHMSEEALRASVVYEFDRWLTATGKRRLDPVDAKLNGLIGFAQSLDIDESSRDDQVWKQFLARYSFPPEVDRDVIQRLLDAEHHHYAGSPEMVASLRRELPAQVIEALRRPEVGEPVSIIG
ncbi:MAG: hypothetical protein HYZ28_10770 [Myxococcales bacterium]|nr:hypothetical protein [Myxococcales bacterium]